MTVSAEGCYFEGMEQAFTKFVLESSGLSPSIKMKKKTELSPDAARFCSILELVLEHEKERDAEEQANIRRTLNEILENAPVVLAVPKKKTKAW